MNGNSAEIRWARKLWKGIPTSAFSALDQLLKDYKLSAIFGDICYLNGGWYVTHTGLLRLAYRRRCRGIEVKLVPSCSSGGERRWVFRATVFKSAGTRGFVGYGDAEPSNVSSLVRGAELRVAETRAVNRALRKAYGIGICSVEEIGSSERQTPEHPVRKVPPDPSNGSASNGHDLNGNGTRVRDHLCQLIRQHKLDAELVKAYAVDFCRTNTLRDASREQVEKFVAHLADCAAKDRTSLLCQLNSYAPQKDGAA